MKYVMLMLAVFILPAASLAQKASLAECQQLHNKIERYTKLRRSGGSSRQMETWKKTRQRHEARFRAGDCYKYGTELK